VPDNLWDELWNASNPVSSYVALAPGEYSIDYLHVVNGVTLTCQGDPTAINSDSGGTDTNRHGSGVTINSTTITVDAGGGLSATGCGFRPGQGPGGSGNGGSHGGKNATPGGGITYGSASEPTALGSGGGNALGGGAIKLNVLGTLTINGSVSADGRSHGGTNGAGGAGGSLWLIADTFTGSGSIKVNGGRSGPNRYGAGAGRISLAWATGNRSFDGIVEAIGGGTGGGTVGQVASQGTIYVPSLPDNLWGELWNATYPVNGSVALAPGEYTIPNLYIANNSILACQGDPDAINSDSGGTAGDPHGTGVIINATNITIDQGARLSAVGQGFIHDSGHGKGGNAGDCSGGGGYGGTGGDGSQSAGGGI
jgi:hypothetical protein